MLIALIACLLFAFVDYVGFNTLGQRQDLAIKLFGIKVLWYRILQTLFQLMLVYVVGVVFGWIYSLGFMLLWWCWLADFMYYGFAYVINNPKWENRVNLQGTLHQVTWAWWTPYGLFVRGTKRKNEIIPLSILVFQGVLGLVLCWGLMVAL